LGTVVFFPHNLAVVRQVAERGSSSEEIAWTIGSTAGSVRVTCSHHKIRLKRGPRYPGRAAPNQIDHHGWRSPSIRSWLACWHSSMPFFFPQGEAPADPSRGPRQQSAGRDG